MNDVSLIPTDDLITELLNRHDHAVFMGMKIFEQATKEKGGNVVNVRRWYGNSYTCCGLCDSLKRTILNEYDSLEKPIEKDDL